MMIAPFDGNASDGVGATEGVEFLRNVALFLRRVSAIYMVRDGVCGAESGRIIQTVQDAMVQAGILSSTAEGALRMGLWSWVALGLLAQGAAVEAEASLRALRKGGQGDAVE